MFCYMLHLFFCANFKEKGRKRGCIQEKNKEGRNIYEKKNVTSSGGNNGSRRTCRM